jgi:hypothetical protein
MILDDSGQAVWFRPLQNEDKDAFDFKVAALEGRASAHLVGGRPHRPAAVRVSTSSPMAPIARWPASRRPTATEVITMSSSSARRTPRCLTSTAWNAGGPLLVWWAEGRQGALGDHPGGRHRDRRGALRVAQLGARRYRGVSLRATEESEVTLRLLSHQLYRRQSRLQPACSR